jgi:hypothetical protein
MPGFNMPQAISAFIIALGLVEHDGILVIGGVDPSTVASLARKILYPSLTNQLKQRRHYF